MNPAAAESASLSAACAVGEPLACVTCRARKLKCDRLRPACTRCVRVNSSECVYPESRRKPAVKRRNVRELEERLAQVEGILLDKGDDDKTTPASGGPGSAPSAPQGQSAGDSNFPFGVMDWNIDMEALLNPASTDAQGETPGSHIPMHAPIIEEKDLPDPYGSSATEMIGLGMFESLPPFEIMEELNTFFFASQAPFIPIIQPAMYLQDFYSAPHKKPPMCLQYAIWTMASNGHPKYGPCHDVFYKRARHYADADEMRGYGEHFITLRHAQTWQLIATDEARNMYFTRAAMSGAKAVRLVEMMGLHRLDGPEEAMVPVLSPPTSWIELEERRRVFWGAFCIDSHASISTGWPNLIDVKEVTTRLPCTEDAFTKIREEKGGESPTLEDAFRGASYSTFAGGVVICHIFNQILRHVHRGKPSDRPEDVDFGLFWTRHRDLDNTLSSAFMFLPDRFRLPANLRDPTAVHTNLNLHASVICLHHCAVEKVDVHGLDQALKAVSTTRLKTAAEEIINIVKLTSHISSSYKSPLVALSMYCAASVYVYHAKDSATQGLSDRDHSNFDFIVGAMEAIGREHLITRAFLQQVYLDVEHNGVAAAMRMPRLGKYKTMFGMCQSNIPLLVRSSVSRHTKPMSPLPGRLPLDCPVGSPIGGGPGSSSTAAEACTAAGPGFGGAAGLRKFDFGAVVVEEDMTTTPLSDEGGGGGNNNKSRSSSGRATGSGSSPDKESSSSSSAAVVAGERAAADRSKRKRMVSPVPESAETMTGSAGYVSGLFADFATAAAGGPVDNFFPTTLSLLGGRHGGPQSATSVINESTFTANLAHRSSGGGSGDGSMGSAGDSPPSSSDPSRRRRAAAAQRNRPRRQEGDTAMGRGSGGGGARSSSGPTSGSVSAAPTAATTSLSREDMALVDDLLEDFGAADQWDVMNDLVQDGDDVLFRP